MNSVSKTGVTLYDGRVASPEQRVAQLKTLRESDQFQYIDGEFKRALAQLEDKIFNTKTEKDEREVLVATRDYLIKKFCPAKLIEDGISYAESDIKNRESEASRRGD